MELPFTDHPGRRERDLRRRHDNPLFDWPAPQVAPAELLAAQRADHEELEAFTVSLRKLVRRAMELPPETGSETILALKEDLERHYEQACGLPAPLEQERAAIRRLIETIMTAVRRQAGGDPLALSELEAEETARALHFRLVDLPLIADLLHPESPIQREDLAPSVLTAGEAEIAAVLEVFEPAEVAQIVDDGAALLAARAAAGTELAAAAERLAALRAGLPASAEPAPPPDEA